MINLHSLLRGGSALAAAMAVLASTGAIANASDDMTTMVCREAHAGEKPTAKMVGSSTALVCKPFAVSMKMSDGKLKTIGSVRVKAASGPDLTGALTADQINAAYVKWLEARLSIDPATEHSP